MRFFTQLFTAVGLAGLLAAPVLAQDQDETRKKILEGIEKRLRIEDEKLLKDLEQALDKVLSAKQRKAAPPAAKPAVATLATAM